MATARVEGTDYIVKRVTQANGITQLLVRTLATVDATDTIPITLTNFGIGRKGFIGIMGFVETTDNSIYAQEADTTAVNTTTGVLTITIAAGTDDDRRHIIVFGHSLNP